MDMRNTALRDVELETVVEGARKFEEFLCAGLQVLRGLRLSLEETSRVKQSIKRGGQPLDWAQFLIDLSADYPQLAEELKQVECLKFEFGRLHLRMDDDHRWGPGMLWFKENLKDFTEKRFGRAFSIRLKTI